VFLAWMPYPARNRLLASDEHRGKSLPELELALREAVADYLRDLAREAAAQDAPRVLAGHLTVSGAVFGSERSVMLGGDIAVMKSALADPVWDYVALGHIHKHQNLTAGETGVPPVVYAGSLERIDFGEENEAKSFVWAEVTRGGAVWRAVPVHARPFVTIRFDARTEENPTAAILAELDRRSSELQDAVVRLAVTLTSGQSALLDERALRKAAAGASNFVIQPEVVQESRARLGSDGAESLPPIELLKRYFDAKRVPEDRVAELLAAAEILMAGPHDPA
jgi:exonuclease SbcD